MVYLIVFGICLLIDSYKRKDKGFRLLLIGSVYIILCFGYTTGTDWPSYELAYQSGTAGAHFSEREPGLGFLISIFHPIIEDFWLFNGLCKVFFLFSLVSMISIFTSKIWTTIALSLVFSTMFLVVNCPMRFMLSCAFLFNAFRLFMKKRKIFACFIGFVAFLFHITIIVPILIIISGIFAHKFYRLKPIALYIITLLSLWVSSNAGIYSFVFAKVLSLLGLEVFSSGSYSFFNMSSPLNVGTLWNLALLVIIIKNKNKFEIINHGSLIFYYAITYFWLYLILRPIPTAFRLSVFNGEMACIAITILLSLRQKKRLIIPKLYKYGIYCMFSILLLKMGYSSYAYYPYTNSLPYIIFGHKKFSDRTHFNSDEYQKEFGYSEENNKDDLKEID